jgi:hypothetical protein
MQHGFDGISFRLMKIKVIRDVPLRDNQRVAGSNREGISDRKAQFILSDDTGAVDIAKYAVFHR